ncbi:Psychosine receptor [Mizuhopecten yessoensis]|uniref:Psychosine receptor n=1 Tax=Mizuhopecten yessoensis TaxID=6573 RepID=A0A210QF38_MIZYE|nr:Psychosine receptor [Mizuhopecten yessoensis]
MADISNLTKSSNSSNTIHDPMTFFLFPALVICFIGIPGTLKTIHFYRRQSKTSAGGTPILLMALAVYDTLALVTSIPYICLAINMLFVDSHEGAQMFFCHYYIPNYLVRFPKYCSNFLLMIIAMSRLYSVLRPLTWKKVFTRNLAFGCTGAVTIVIPFSLLPLAFEFSCAEINNNTVAYKQLSDFGKNRGLFKTIYIFNMIMYYFVPLFTVLVCNIALIIFLFHRMYNPMNTVPLTSSQARELKMTKLVLVFTCIFVVCVSPLGIFYPLRGLGNSPIPQPVYRAIMPMATLLESINYSVNSLVYYIGSARFRADVKQIICCKKSRVSPER